MLQMSGCWVGLGSGPGLELCVYSRLAPDTLGSQTFVISNLYFSDHVFTGIIYINLRSGVEVELKRGCPILHLSFIVHLCSACQCVAVQETGKYRFPFIYLLSPDLSDMAPYRPGPVVLFDIIPDPGVLSHWGPVFGWPISRPARFLGLWETHCWHLPSGLLFLITLRFSLVTVIRHTLPSTPNDLGPVLWWRKVCAADSL